LECSLSSFTESGESDDHSGSTKKSLGNKSGSFSEEGKKIKELEISEIPFHHTPMISSAISDAEQNEQPKFLRKIIPENIRRNLPKIPIQKQKLNITNLPGKLKPKFQEKSCRKIL